jgi:hypothetical protein
MSNLKFDKQDWDKKRALEADDFKTSLADISERRRQQVQNKQFETESKLRRDTLNETTRHNKAMEKLGLGKISTAAEVAKGKMTEAQKKAFEKNVEATSQEVLRLSQAVSADKVDEATARARIKGILQTKLGLHPKMAEAYVDESAWFGLSSEMRDPGEILSSINELAALQPVIADLRKQVPPGYVLGVDAEGNPQAVPADQINEYIEQGYKVYK